LCHVGEIVGGGTPSAGDSSNWKGGEIAWITPADMGDIGKYASHGARDITESGLARSPAKLMPPGAVIYSSRAPIGHIAIAANSLCTSQGFKSLVPLAGLVPEYAYYALIFLTPAIRSRASGTTFKEISGRELGQVLIPLPPTAEQTRIAELADRLLSSLDRLCRREP
jgi:type I restriction enzyme S subunit